MGAGKSAHQAEMNSQQRTVTRAGYMHNEVNFGWSASMKIILKRRSWNLSDCTEQLHTLLSSLKFIQEERFQWKLWIEETKWDWPDIKIRRHVGKSRMTERQNSCINKMTQTHAHTLLLPISSFSAIYGCVHTYIDYMYILSVCLAVCAVFWVSNFGCYLIMTFFPQSPTGILQYGLNNSGIVVKNCVRHRTVPLYACIGTFLTVEHPVFQATASELVRASLMFWYMAQLKLIPVVPVMKF